MNIAVAGTGYVGLSIATLLAQHNHVTAVDVVPERVDLVNNHKSPIQDDYIEISLDEAKEKGSKPKLGDMYEEELSVEEMKDKDIGRFISAFKQRINKAEKDALLSVFENKIGTIVGNS